MSAQKLGRRELLHGLGVATVAAAAAVPFAAKAQSSPAYGDGAAPENKLLEIIRRYEESVDETTAQCKLRDMEDDELDARVDRSCEILAAVVGLPAATTADALAAFDFVVREHIEENGLHPDALPFHAAIASLLASIRGHIASTGDVRS